MGGFSCSNLGNDIIFPETKCSLQFQHEKAETPGGRVADVSLLTDDAGMDGVMVGAMKY